MSTRRPFGGSRSTVAIRSTVLALALVTAAVLPASAQDTVMVVQVFSVRHAAPTDISAGIQPLLSRDGSITVHPAKGKITVRDTAEVMAKVTKAISRLDRAPEAFRLRIELLEGSTTKFSVPDVREVDARLQNMFPFKAYRSLGVAEVVGVTGDDAEVDLGERYRVQLTALDHRLEATPFGMPDRGLRLNIQPFVLEQVTNGSVREVIRTRMLLSENQEVFIGAGGREDSSRGIVLIIKSLPGRVR